MATQLSATALTENSSLIAGNATLTEDAIKGVRKEAIEATRSTMRLLGWASADGVMLSSLHPQVHELEASAKTVMYVATERAGSLVCVGLLALADTLKDDSIAAIQQLHSMGIQTAMITGDNALTAQAIAEKVGVGIASVYRVLRENRSAA